MKTRFGSITLITPYIVNCIIIFKKSVPGKFKDQTAGKPISEFCGLRSKMYAFTVANESVVKKAKTLTLKTM